MDPQLCGKVGLSLADFVLEVCLLIASDGAMFRQPVASVSYLRGDHVWAGPPVVTSL